MGKRLVKYYSAYRRKTDMPVIIHGTLGECMTALGISKATFQQYLSHTRYGTRKCRYEVFVDEDDDDGEA